MHEPDVGIEAVAFERDSAFARGARSSGRTIRLILSTGKARFGATLLGIFTFVAIFAPWIAPYNPHSTASAPYLPVSREHLLGTTAYGQDIFSQVIWGTRQSLVIAIVGGVAATILGLVIGITAAYFGGLVDRSLSFTADVFLVLPGLPFMIVITAYLPRRGTWLLVVVIVITGWAFGARQFRAQGLSLRRREFVEAARARGEGHTHIIFRELMPTLIPLIAVSVLNAALYSVLAAAGLQFLGLGDVTSISWGTMLYWAQNNEALSSGAPLWAIVPGACIGLLGGAFAFLNYGFDELANPALREKSRRG